MARTVVITGASAGIGRAGGTPCLAEADVADFGQVDAAARRIEEALGPVQVWVNCGFTSVFAPFTEINAEEFRRVTEVSYLGFVHGTMAALNLMRPRDAGTIVQVGSALGERSIPLQSAYCGAKHAICGFTSSLRCELMHEQSTGTWPGPATTPSRPVLANVGLTPRRPGSSRQAGPPLATKRADKL